MGVPRRVGVEPRMHGWAIRVDAIRTVPPTLDGGLTATVVGGQADSNEVQAVVGASNRASRDARWAGSRRSSTYCFVAPRIEWSVVKAAPQVSDGWHDANDMRSVVHRHAEHGGQEHDDGEHDDGHD